MNQQMLDQLIGAPPPSTVDVGAVIVSQRRRQRLRRFGTGAAAAAGVVIAVVAGMSLAGGPHSRGASPPAAASPSARPSPSLAGLVLETGTAAGRERTRAALQEVLEEALTEHAPQAGWIYMPDVPGERRTPDGHPVLRVERDPVTFEGRSGLTAGGRKGGFYLSVRPTGCEPGTSCSPAYECDDLPPGCTEARTPGGLRVVRWLENLPAGDGDRYVFYGVQVMLRGGDHTLTLRAVNYFGGDAAPVSAPAPPLTRTQLDGIAGTVADRIAG
ncbi:hypothetical protein [Nucisporomicrobium flavum]|uniref:hypothetical protein n=1 Tax=Nucisporomicrobium flavum TaxID=2785915 RepID=UPI0018F2AE90|nr:hypothetical protein [Nucisporomicrobium flavum]